MTISEILKRGAAELNVPLSDEQISSLERYSDILKEKNKVMNLTAVTDDEGIAVKHFLDSLTALQTGKVGKSVIDVGTGAGFPGLVLKLARPDISLTLLDSLNKRITFLKETAALIGAGENTEFIHARAEDAAMNAKLREKFDTAVSRAVANMRVLSEWCLPFVRTGGYFLALKGTAAERELEEARRAIFILGGEVENVFDAHIPFSELEHKIIIIKKVRRTPSKFPRKPGIAVKSPIETCYNLSKNK